MTILSESTAKCATPLGYVLFIFTLIFVVLAVNMARDDYCWAALGFIIFAVLVFVTSMICCLEPYRQIKVILSDDYPAVKLYDEYDVKERDGDIWVLREKEALKED